MPIELIGAVTGVIAAGAWLRWAVAPVCIAFGVGRQVERLITGPARYVPACALFYKFGARDRARRR